MQDLDPIIVFRQYDNSIDASIAKTKLDAFDIPCFLTQENLANLYPTLNLLRVGVRLHIFAGDEDRARELLNEMTIDRKVDDEAITCPGCSSNRIEQGLSTQFWPKLLNIISIITLTLIVPQKKVRRCLDCRYEF